MVQFSIRLGCATQWHTMLFCIDTCKTENFISAKEIHGKQSEKQNVEQKIDMLKKFQHGIIISLNGPAIRLPLPPPKAKQEYRICLLLFKKSARIVYYNCILLKARQAL